MNVPLHTLLIYITSSNVDFSHYLGFTSKGFSNGCGFGTVKPFRRKYGTVWIATHQNFVLSEAFSYNCFHWLIKLITFADKTLDWLARSSVCKIWLEPNCGVIFSYVCMCTSTSI